MIITVTQHCRDSAVHILRTSLKPSLVTPSDVVCPLVLVVRRSTLLATARRAFSAVTRCGILCRTTCYMSYIYVDIDTDVGSSKSAETAAL